MWLEPQTSSGNVELLQGTALLQVRSGEEALGIVITEVVFKAVSVRSANTSPGGGTGKRSVY